MSVKRKKTTAESPASGRSVSTSVKKTRTTAKPRAASVKKTPSKRKAAATSQSASAKKKRKAEEEGGEDEDEDMQDGEDEGEDEPGSSSSSGLSLQDAASTAQQSVQGAVSGLQSGARSVMQRARDEFSHLLPAARDKAQQATGATRRSLDSAKERALQVADDVRQRVKKGRGGRRRKEEKNEDEDDEGEEEDDDEEDEEEEEDTKPRRKGTPAVVRHSSRPSTQVSTAATDSIVRSRRSGGGRAAHGEEAGTAARSRQPQAARVPEARTVIQSWRDLVQVAPHLVLQTLLIVGLHIFTLSVIHDDFRRAAFRWMAVPPFITLTAVSELAFGALKHFLLHYHLVLVAFLVANYFFRASVRSVLLRHADTTIRDVDYYSSAFTAHFSRAVYGVVHLAFIYVFWHRYKGGRENVLDLNILFWLNLGFWAQDALTNFVLRSQATSRHQAAVSYTFALVSLLWTVVVTPDPSALSSIAGDEWHTTIIRPAMLGCLIIAVFFQGWYSSGKLLRLIDGFQPWLKPALYSLVFLLYPLLFLTVVVPAFASLLDVVYHVLNPLHVAPWTHKYTVWGHRIGNPTGQAGTRKAK